MVFWGVAKANTSVGEARLPKLSYYYSQTAKKRCFIGGIAKTMTGQERLTHLVVQDADTCVGITIGNTDARQEQRTASVNPPVCSSVGIL
jgi:hypothetical protein